MEFENSWYQGLSKSNKDTIKTLSREAVRILWAIWCIEKAEQELHQRLFQAEFHLVRWLLSVPYEQFDRSLANDRFLTSRTSLVSAVPTYLSSFPQSLRLLPTTNRSSWSIRSTIPFFRAVHRTISIPLLFLPLQILIIASRARHSSSPASFRPRFSPSDSPIAPASSPSSASLRGKASSTFRFLLFPISSSLSALFFQNTQTILAASSLRSSSCSKTRPCSTGVVGRTASSSEAIPRASRCPCWRFRAPSAVFWSRGRSASRKSPSRSCARRPWSDSSGCSWRRRRSSRSARCSRRCCAADLRCGKRKRFGS